MEQIDKKENKHSRREFLKNLTIAGGSAIIVGTFGFIFHSSPEDKVIKAIVVDFDKCTGCRTCEAVCSSYNNKIEVNGGLLDGPGNPNLSNIRIHHYNPDVDIPVICNLCDDAPCITACPVPPDLFTGRKALFRDEKNNTIRNDIERCIGCGQCAKACKNLRTGTIISNPDTGKPERICNLCNGDPQCVKYCTYEALTYIKVDNSREFFGLSADKIAQVLYERFYNIDLNN
ncbi:MAG: 4Fe-4S dicluster domain-containing protein [Bacteroidales bacterium]|nr:4Fe-4S dicluster domain-containing protein [Bacteroidales bacterium]